MPLLFWLCSCSNEMNRKCHLVGFNVNFSKLAADVERCKRFIAKAMWPFLEKGEDAWYQFFMTIQVYHVLQSVARHGSWRHPGARSLEAVSTNIFINGLILFYPKNRASWWHQQWTAISLGQHLASNLWCMSFPISPLISCLLSLSNKGITCQRKIAAVSSVNYEK